MRITDEKLLVFDGACGSNLQALDIPESAWKGSYRGCNEYLNLSAPEAVVKLHGSFLEAGATVVETNTFGASSIVLSEYGLEGEVEQINRAAVANARKAIDGQAGRYVAGSMGPGTRLPSLGHIPHRVLHDAYFEQALALCEAGADILIIETCQDLAQAKLSLIAALDAVETTGTGIPVMVSVTVETTGTMLVGTDIASVIATFEPFPLFSLGLNCATGPGDMAPHIDRLSRGWPGRISVIPNAGMPEVRGSTTFYPLSPEAFAAQLRGFVVERGVSVVGGCCGTTPQHIHALARALEGVSPKERSIEYRPALSSLYCSVEARQEIPPLLIGERMNTHGSRRFKKLLLADDLEGAAAMGPQQEKVGAHLLDICAAYAGRDERADMLGLVGFLNGIARAPLVLDTTRPDTIEAALEIIPGRCLVNSINLEDGGATADRVLAAVKRYGAAVVALTIGPDGMAMTAVDKLAVARELYDLAVKKHGLRPHDLFFDALTFTIGSGDPKLRDAASETLEGIRLIKEAFPGSFTSLGVSNVSFGLPAHSRKFLNSVFLHKAIDAGLDAAIVDAGKIVPMARIADEDIEVCLDLLLDRTSEKKGDSPLQSFIDRFEGRTETSEKEDEISLDRAEEALEARVLGGDRTDLADVLDIVMTRHRPLDIINGILVPAMRKVGELFGRGEMLLPFVLQSAEVMKASVKHLEPHMDRTDEDEGIRILLATVQGDVHDIGKNLVDIILSNNGYRVFNAGTNVPSSRIIELAKEHRVDVIGLSGLLVKSAMEMRDSIPRFGDAGLDVPILLGGAALTSRFVALECAPAHERPVVYCADAFSGLKAVQEIERGELRSTVHSALPEPASPSIGPTPALDRDNPVPEPPFVGARYETDIDLGPLYPRLNREVLFRGRWGYRRGKMSEAEHHEIIARKARPVLERLISETAERRLLRASVAYGYFPCRSTGNRLFVDGGDSEEIFEFPRQAFSPYLCLADYFKAREEGGDVVGFFVATVGREIMERTRELFESDRYSDYLHLHGFAVEMAEALAAHWHDVMREQLRIRSDVRDASSPGCCGQGNRYGFGYPSCPDLGQQAQVFRLLDASRIGVELSESMEIIPEASTSAMIVHHPQADYFTV